MANVIQAWPISEHPHPEKVCEWVRNNWHDLADHYLEEMVASLKAFADYHGVKVDYSLSVVPDRGEYIKFDGDINFNDRPKGECPLTGVCYDMLLIERSNKVGLCEKVLDVLHHEGEAAYSDFSITEHCEANEYMFFIDGAFCKYETRGV